MRGNYVALSVRIFYHRIMTFWQTAKRGEYMQPCSRRQLALSTRTVALLGHYAREGNRPEGYPEGRFSFT
jgi:hypothetical protein